MKQTSFISSPSEKAAAMAAGNALAKNDAPGQMEKQCLLPIQCSLTVGAANDPLEHEADNMADTVMRMPENNFIQRKCAHCEEEEKAQRKPLSASITPFIQTKSNGEATTSASLSNKINSSRGNGTAMDNGTKTFMESRFGSDFSSVNIHTGSESVMMNRELNAKAFTVGNDIYFNEGQYNPQSDSGKHLLAHELTHTIQQGNNISRKIQRAENDTNVGCSSLTDTKPDVNAYVNAALAGLRPASGAPTAATMIAGLRSGIGSDMWTSPGRTQIEGWADSLPATKAVLPAASATKYSGTTYGLWSTPFRILNPTMKVNGICIGSDKLGHFFQQGHDYYIRQHRAGGSVATAVAWGQSTEVGNYGLATTGVYSNADLEANRKGLDFYNALAASPSLTFDIASYINGNWSEVNNPNFYESSVGGTVWRNILRGAWSGDFVDGTTAATVPVILNLSPGSGNTITGTYTRTDTSLLHTGRSVPVAGTITGTITLNTTTPPGSATTAVSGVTVTFTWTEGGALGRSGSGTWTNVQENRLSGTWGNGSAISGGGSWNITK